MGCVIFIFRDGKYTCCATFESNDTIGHLMMAREIIKVNNMHRDSTNMQLAGYISSLLPFSGLTPDSWNKIKSHGVTCGKRIIDADWTEGIVKVTTDETEIEWHNASILKRTNIVLDMDKKIMKVEFGNWMSVVDYKKACGGSYTILDFDRTCIPFIEVDSFCLSMYSIFASHGGDMVIADKESLTNIVCFPPQEMVSAGVRSLTKISVWVSWEERFGGSVSGTMGVVMRSYDDTWEYGTVGEDDLQGITETFEPGPRLSVEVDMNKMAATEVLDIFLVVSLDGKKFRDIKNLTISADFPGTRPFPSPLLFDGHPSCGVVAAWIRKDKWRTFYLPMGRSMESLGAESLQDLAKNKMALRL